MFTISFGLNLTKIEDLIMATKAELSAKLAELSLAVSEEAVQVQEAVKALEAVVSGLYEKVSALELDADLAPEIEALAKIKGEIEGIYSPAEPAPIEAPVEPAPVV